MKNYNINFYIYLFLSLTTIGLLFIFAYSYYFNIKYLFPKNLSIYETNYFADLILVAFILNGAIFFPFIFYNKIKLFLKKFILINITFFILILINSDNIINYFSRSTYELIYMSVLSFNNNKNNVKNSILYKEFLEDKINNDANKLKKYTFIKKNKPIYKQELTDKLISANKNQQNSIDNLLKKNHSNPKIIKKINLIKNDDFISLNEYKDFINYVNSL